MLETFLRGARIGTVDKELLLQINKRLMISQKEAKSSAHPSASWIAHTRAAVAKFNQSDFNDKVIKGRAHFRVVARHTPTTQLQSTPNGDQRKLLYQTIKATGAPTFVDLAIGTRVSCVKTLGTQIGEIEFYLSRRPY